MCVQQRSCYVCARVSKSGNHQQVEQYAVTNDSTHNILACMRILRSCVSVPVKAAAATQRSAYPSQLYGTKVDTLQNPWMFFKMHGICLSGTLWTQYITSQEVSSMLLGTADIQFSQSCPINCGHFDLCFVFLTRSIYQVEPSKICDSMTKWRWPLICTCHCLLLISDSYTNK